MERRSFMLACATFAASLGMLSSAGALRAMAASLAPGSNVERILRITHNATHKMRLLNTREVESIIRQKKGRHIIISLQSGMEYEAGHVPGALLFTPDSLTEPDKLRDFINKLPRNKTIVLICPNGQLSSAVALFLRQLDFDASSMLFGMCGWNRKYAGSGNYQGDIDGAISMESIRLPMEKKHAPAEYSEQDDSSLIISSTENKFFDTVTAEYLRDNPDEMMLFCLRRPEDYAAGHISGSINIPSEAFYAGDKIIMQIPQNKKILLSCYVGHYSSGAALLLTQLGYEAHTLAWGMAGWNNKHIGPALKILNQDLSLAVEQGSGTLLMSSSL